MPKINKELFERRTTRNYKIFLLWLMMMNQVNPPADQNHWSKCLNTTSLKITNNQKFFSQYANKTLGTNLIYRPMSPSPLFEWLICKGCVLSGREGTLSCHQSFIKTFLIRWINNFGDFYYISIGWFLKLSVQMFQSLIVIHRNGNLCIIIWDVHQFIDHCLIPLDPWRAPHNLSTLCE